MASTVAHDAVAHRFSLSLEGGAVALLDYVVIEGAAGPIWDAVHTFVPPAGRGRGIADLLTRAFVDAANAAGAKVRGSCSYVAAWLARQTMR